MPQAHKAGTKAISVWLAETDRSLLKEIVASGMFEDQSDFLRKQIHEWAKIIRKGAHDNKNPNTTGEGK